MHNNSHLQVMPIEQLKDIGKNFGVSRTRGESEINFRNRVTVAVDSISPKQAGSNAAPVFKPAYSSKEQVLEIAEKYAGKGFEVKFNDEDETWHFRCRGAEDSGTLNQPISVIDSKAKNVAVGARNPRGLKAGESVIFSA